MSNLLVNIKTGVVTEVEGCFLVNTSKLDDEGLKLFREMFPYSELENANDPTARTLREKFGKKYGRPLQQVFDTLAEHGNSRVAQ